MSHSYAARTFFERPNPAIPPRQCVPFSTPTPGMYLQSCRVPEGSWGAMARANLVTLVGAGLPSSSCSGLFQVPSQQTIRRSAMVPSGAGSPPAHLARERDGRLGVDAAVPVLAAVPLGVVLARPVVDPVARAADDVLDLLPGEVGIAVEDQGGDAGDAGAGAGGPAEGVRVV